MPKGERSANSGGRPSVISFDLVARSDRVLNPYLSIVVLLQTMTSLSSAVDGGSTVRLSGNAVFNSSTCCETLVAVGTALGSFCRRTYDNSEFVYSGRRSSSPPEMAL